jgi:hypothetical protein
MVVFTRVVVVGNLNIITTIVDAWWQYDYCTWFWVMCMCLSPKQYSSLYIPPVSKQMWQCWMSTTCPLHGEYVGCFPMMVAILLHRWRSIMVWFVVANMCFPHNCTPIASHTMQENINTFYFCCIVLEAQPNHKHEINLFFYVQFLPNLQGFCTKYGEC